MSFKHPKWADETARPSFLPQRPTRGPRKIRPPYPAQLAPELMAEAAAKMGL